ncbi:MAG: AsnC family transcriptional regulator [Thermoprotei archaeon]|nr:MAG: AsnC family transcriptional regulator [Thermoprotei archaeon]
MSLDDRDYLILKNISKSLKISYKELSKITNTPETTIRYRVQRLRAQGILKDYAAIISEEKLGYNVTAIINIRIYGRPITKEITDKISSLKQVLFLYVVTGDRDIVALVKCRGIDELGYIIEKIHEIKGVERTTTSIVLKKLKECYEIPL